MKDWQVIMWLVLFFPLGIYLMFKYTDWPKFIKLGIIGIFTLVTLIEGVGTWAPPILLTSVVIAIMGIYQIVRNKNKKQSIGLITLGIILFSFSNLHIAAQEAEQTRIEQQEVEAQAEKERLAEEKKQQEIARKKEQERIEAEKKLKEQLIEAIEKAEDEPTKSNYDKAISLLDQLNDKDERLVERLEKIKPTVDAYEEELKLAKEAIEKAEENLNRETYNEAYKLVVTLSIPNSRLDRQLEALDQEITKIEEEEKLVKEKEEAERIAAEKVEAERVEAERVAAEKAAQEKERQQATQNSQAQSNESSSQHVTQVDNVEQVVYIAPQSGTKYHFSAGCRGLNRANSIQEMSLSEAQSRGYDLCGWEK